MQTKIIIDMDKIYSFILDSISKFWVYLFVIFSGLGWYFDIFKNYLHSNHSYFEFYVFVTQYNKM